MLKAFRGMQRLCGLLHLQCASIPLVQAPPVRLANHEQNTIQHRDLLAHKCTRVLQPCPRCLAPAIPCCAAFFRGSFQLKPSGTSQPLQEPASTWGICRLQVELESNDCVVFVGESEKPHGHLDNIYIFIYIYIYISLQIVGLCISNCIVSTYVTYKWSNGIYMANPKPPDRDGDPWRTPLMWTGTWSHCRCCTVALGAATFIVDFPCLCKFHEEQMVKRTVKLCYYSI